MSVLGEIKFVSALSLTSVLGETQFVVLVCFLFRLFRWLMRVMCGPSVLILSKGAIWRLHRNGCKSMAVSSRCVSPLVHCPSRMFYTGIDGDLLPWIRVCVCGGGRGGGGSSLVTLSFSLSLWIQNQTLFSQAPDYPAIGSLCVAVFVEDNNLYRARVESIDWEMQKAQVRVSYLLWPVLTYSLPLFDSASFSSLCWCKFEQ